MISLYSQRLDLGYCRFRQDTTERQERSGCGGTWRYNELKVVRHGSTNLTTRVKRGRSERIDVRLEV